MHEFFDFETLKSKTSCIFLNRSINFDKSETESKMEKSPAQGFNNRAGWKFRGYQISGAMGVGESLN